MTNDIVQYMHKDTIRERFAELMGERNAAAYISSVLIAVSNNDTLANCHPKSIYTSALRAATLRLSVDPATGEAYLVPFKGNATLIVGYKGYIKLAVNTGKYRYINAGPVYEGETIEENRISGFIKLGGGKTSDKVIGYLAAFEMVNGYAKVIYMTVEDIDAHAKRYSKSYAREDSLWKDPVEHPKMEKKTVLRNLLRKWGYFDPNDAMTLEQTEIDAEIVDGELTDLPPIPDEPTEPEPSRTEAEILDDLGYDAPPQKTDGNGSKPTQPELIHELPPMTLQEAIAFTDSKGKRYGGMDADTLNGMSRSMSKKMRDNHLTAEETAEYRRKLQAIGVILDSLK